MKPIKFEEQNIIFAEDQEGFEPLPAFYNRLGQEGEVVSCWNLSFKERVKLLFTGTLWHSIATYHGPPQGTFMTVNKNEILITK